MMPERSEIRSGLLTEPKPNLSISNTKAPVAARIRWDEESVERDLTRALVVVLTPLLFAEWILRAADKGLWFDEILTIIVSSQPHISGVVDLLKHGVDGHPPLMYLIERMMLSLGGNPRITLRLPSMLGFVCILICMGAFLRRRVGNLVALVSVGALFVTHLFDPLAFEARSYCLMTACIAFALLCYERIDSRKWGALFALSLAAATSLHFYAVISFFPFGLAELVNWIVRRRFRMRVWAAFVVGGLPYLAFWRILVEQRVLYGERFWAVPTFWKFANSFYELFHISTAASAAFYAATLFYLLYLVFSGEVGSDSSTPRGSGFSFTDVALTLGFFVLPFVTLAIAELGHGGFSGRYLATTALGMSLAVSLILSRLSKPAVAAAGIFVLLAVTIHEAAFWNYLLLDRRIANPIEPLAEMSRETKLPLLVPDGLQFLPMWYVAQPDFKSSLYFLDNPDAQFEASKSDTTTLLLRTLKDFAPVHVQTFPEFAANHSRFLVESNGQEDDYWPRRLIQLGYSLRAISVDPPRKSATEGMQDPPKAILYIAESASVDRSNKPADGTK